MSTSRVLCRTECAPTIDARSVTRIFEFHKEHEHSKPTKHKHRNGLEGRCAYLSHSAGGTDTTTCYRQVQLRLYRSTLMLHLL